ncbi:MAG: hypothetical protein QOE71_3143 [Pseudonocardiales bacterium]|jgi:hypothetical protein|nr:hypothetical protein [Pseudonocardiales bacterium]MDQ1752087.1 hypothetical protein [Pseudonocardiales bacterium]
MSQRNRWFAAVLLVAGISVAGCTSGTASSDSAGEEPATVTAIDGSDQLHKIQLTEDAAARIGLTTDTVRTLPSGKQLAVAWGAVLYDQDGTTWVYVRTAPLTFQRQQVSISRVTGDVAVLQSGPTAGTAVANVGVAELRGAEDGVPGE